MALMMNNQAIATGRARCRCCGKIIKAGTSCIYATNYLKSSGYCHKHCAKGDREEYIGK